MTTKNDLSFRDWIQKKHGRQNDDEKSLTGSTHQIQDSHITSLHPSYASVKTDQQNVIPKSDMDPSTNYYISDSGIPTHQNFSDPTASPATAYHSQTAQQLDHHVTLIDTPRHITPSSRTAYSPESRSDFHNIPSPPYQRDHKQLPPPIPLEFYVHLGGTKIVTPQQSRKEESPPRLRDYPPPVQSLGANLSPRWNFSTRTDSSTEYNRSLPSPRHSMDDLFGRSDHYRNLSSTPISQTDYPVSTSPLSLPLEHELTVPEPFHFRTEQRNDWRTQLRMLHEGTSSVSGAGASSSPSPSPRRTRPTTQRSPSLSPSPLRGSVFRKNTSKGMFGTGLDSGGGVASPVGADRTGSSSIRNDGRFLIDHLSASLHSRTATSDLWGTPQGADSVSGSATAATSAAAAAAGGDFYPQERALQPPLLRSSSPHGSPVGGVATGELEEVQAALHSAVQSGRTSPPLLIEPSTNIIPSVGSSTTGIQNNLPVSQAAENMSAMSGALSQSEDNYSNVGGVEPYSTSSQSLPSSREVDGEVRNGSVPQSERSQPSLGSSIDWQPATPLRDVSTIDLGPASPATPLPMMPASPPVSTSHLLFQTGSFTPPQPAQAAPSTIDAALETLSRLNASKKHSRLGGENGGMGAGMSSGGGGGGGLNGRTHRPPSAGRRSFDSFYMRAVMMEQAKQRELEVLREKAAKPQTDPECSFRPNINKDFNRSRASSRNRNLSGQTPSTQSASSGSSISSSLQPSDSTIPSSGSSAPLPRSKDRPRSAAGKSASAPSTGRRGANGNSSGSLSSTRGKSRAADGGRNGRKESEGEQNVVFGEALLERQIEEDESVPIEIRLNTWGKMRREIEEKRMRENKDLPSDCTFHPQVTPYKKPPPPPEHITALLLQTAEAHQRRAAAAATSRTPPRPHTSVGNGRTTPRGRGTKGRPVGGSGGGEKNGAGNGNGNGNGNGLPLPSSVVPHTPRPLPETQPMPFEFETDARTEEDSEEVRKRRGIKMTMDDYTFHPVISTSVPHLSEKKKEYLKMDPFERLYAQTNTEQTDSTHELEALQQMMNDDLPPSTSSSSSSSAPSLPLFLSATHRSASSRRSLSRPRTPPSTPRSHRSTTPHPGDGSHGNGTGSSRVLQRKEFIEFLNRQQDSWGSRRVQEMLNQAPPIQKPMVNARSEEILRQAGKANLSFMDRLDADEKEKKRQAGVIQLQQTKLADSLTFRPAINAASAALPSRGVDAMSNGVMMQRKADMELLRQQLEAQQKQSTPFTPSLSSRSMGVQSKLNLRGDLDTYLSRMKQEKEEATRRVTEEIEKDRAKEDRELTFAPRIHDAPTYIKKIAQSMQQIKNRTPGQSPIDHPALSSTQRSLSSSRGYSTRNSYMELAQLRTLKF